MLRYIDGRKSEAEGRTAQLERERQQLLSLRKDEARAVRVDKTMFDTALEMALANVDARNEANGRAKQLGYDNFDRDLTDDQRAACVRNTRHFTIVGATVHSRDINGEHPP